MGFKGPLSEADITAFLQLSSRQTKVAVNAYLLDLLQRKWIFIRPVTCHSGAGMPVPSLSSSGLMARGGLALGDGSALPTERADETMRIVAVKTVFAVKTMFSMKTRFSMKTCVILAGVAMPTMSLGVARAELPSLSRACVAPQRDIATAAPLRRLGARIKRREKVTILAIGSSSTAGVGASSPGHTYPAQLQAILTGWFKSIDVKIINRGLSGELAAKTATRLRAHVRRDQPDIVVWQVGTNDALSRVSIAQFERTLSSTIGWIRRRHVDVIIVGSQYAPQAADQAHFLEIDRALERVTAARHVALSRRYAAMRFIARSGDHILISNDGLHLNDTGYRCMAEHVAQALIASIEGAGTGQ